MSRLALLGGPSILQPSGASSMDPWAYPDLEEAFVRYTGARYALAVGSGTAALISALVAVGVGPGDEVLTVAHTWIASVAAILRCNAIPIFVDVDRRTFTMDVEDAARKITPQTRAVLPVDLYGLPADIPALMVLARNHDLLVVEDACQSGGAEIHGKKAGSIAHLTAFSFSGKPLSGEGGGMVTTDDRLLYERAMLAGQHRSLLTQRITLPELRRYVDFGGRGDNLRPHAVLAKAVLHDLYSADLRIEARIRNCDFLGERLARTGVITPPHVPSGYKHVYHMYTCLLDVEEVGVRRDLFLEALRAEGVPSTGYMSHANFYFSGAGRPVAAEPIHLRTIFQEKDFYGRGCPFLCPHAKRTPDYSPGTLPVTEWLAQREFSLLQPTLSHPNGPREMQQIVDAIQKVLDNAEELRTAELAGGVGGSGPA
ncbi:MAG TPA: DegT/DnrJ/EryC1/StrS family aminotransferase [Candidatus Methylomirabilis sp.]|nr:DegT/DnrJ/EryC1/StrS family aminotransferase [Candidatus Methylomirabilis sp.]